MKIPFPTKQNFTDAGLLPDKNLSDISRHMKLEGLLTIETGVLRNCEIDYTQIERGSKWILLPENITEIAEDTFKKYNEGVLAARIGHMLCTPTPFLNELEKQLRQRKLVKHPFPVGVQTMEEKRDHLMKQDLDTRILELHLPASIEKVSALAFPVYLNAIKVDAKNPFLISVDGVLFSKDQTVLIRYPGTSEEMRYAVPEGVQTILPGAFDHCVLEQLTLPSSLRQLCSRSVSNAQIDTIKIKNGLKKISSETFVGSTIKNWFLPSTLAQIEDCAFKRIAGIKTMECDSGEINMGSKIFGNSSIDNLSWWSWKQIPKATFINCAIKEIVIPEGVEKIHAYAFAGCYRAERIVIPNSVQEIEPNAFDEGESYDSPVTLPPHLYQYVFRFPAGSPINRQCKIDLWEQRNCRRFIESKDILTAQRALLEKRLGKLTVLQVHMRKRLTRQIIWLDEQLASDT